MTEIQLNNLKIEEEITVGELKVGVEFPKTGIPTKPLTVTENGTYTANEKEGFNPVTVNVAGKKFTTGTVTFASTATQHTITHNLGVAPTIFILYAKITADELNYGVENEQGNRGWNYGYRYLNCRGFSDALNFGGSGAESGDLSQTYTTLIYAGIKRRQFNGNLANSWAVNGQTIKTGYSASYHYYPTNVEFGWIAIE
jgi:hypothetical protein